MPALEDEVAVVEEGGVEWSELPVVNEPGDRRENAPGGEEHGAGDEKSFAELPAV